MSTEITKLLNEKEIDEIAKAVGLIQRTRKLSGSKFFQLIFFNVVNQKKLSLNDLSTQMFLKHGIRISKQALDEHFNDAAVLFLKKILERLIAKSSVISSYEPFMIYDKVRIKDSTCFKLPDSMQDVYKGSGGAAKSVIRIQSEYDLKKNY